MRNPRTSALSMTFALVAIYALVLQMLLGSVLLGSAVAAPVLDGFGNPLCITHAENPAPSDHRDNSKLPQCCTQACSVMVPALAPHLSDNFLINRLEAKAWPVAADSDSGPFKRPETSPGKPRAPPHVA